MALNQFMHSRNPYKHKKPDFAALADKYPDFKRHLSTTLTGKVSLDFKDPEALRSLTCTLLKEDFGIDLVIPLDRIIPTVPLRLNYILWIEDLLEQSGHGGSGAIHGMDVGCGASCIYPLLGAKLKGWHFAASEVDSSAASFAALNVKKNNLSGKINVIEADPDDMLNGIIKAAPRSLYHFTMCNPPFFGNLLEAQGIMTSRTMDRAEPTSVSTAAEGEMIWGEGGEVDFVGRMIKDSLQLREQVVWYTSMVGKKASLGPIKKELAKHKIRNVTTTEFCQGRTMRWGIGWTFNDDIRLPVSPPAKKFKRDKERPPLVIEVPDRALQRALDEVNSGSKVKSSVSEDQRKVKAIAKVVEKLLGTLEIDFKSKPAPKLCSKYILTTHRNTWSNQRRKRRQMSRRLPPKDEASPISETAMARSGSKPAEARQGGDELGRVTKAEPNLGEGGRSSEKAADPVGDSAADRKTAVCETQKAVTADCVTGHDRSVPGQSLEQPVYRTGQGSLESAMQVTSSNKDSFLVRTDSQQSGGTSKEHGGISDDDLIKPLPAMESQERPADKLSKSGHVSPPECGRQVTDHRANPKLKVTTASIPSSEMDSSDGQPGQMSSPEGSKQECLFKCMLTVKMADGKVVLELSWTEGQSREAMHQVGQYIKNQLNKMA